MMARVSKCSRKGCDVVTTGLFAYCSERCRLSASTTRRIVGVWPFVEHAPGEPSPMERATDGE